MYTQFLHFFSNYLSRYNGCIFYISSRIWFGMEGSNCSKKLKGCKFGRRHRRVIYDFLDFVVGHLYY